MSDHTVDGRTMGVLNMPSKTCCILCAVHWHSSPLIDPEKHNAISLATLDDLHGAVDEAADDDSVRVIAITGAGGKAFAAGSDLSEVINRDFKKALEPIVQGLADKLERTPKPTIAAIDGICMGGGLEVALGCDLRVATPQSRFATPEGKLGIIPGGGATARLPRVVGRGWGMEMMLMGEPIGAERALQIGLVTRLVESDALLGEIQKMAEHLASFAHRCAAYDESHGAFWHGGEPCRSTDVRKVCSRSLGADRRQSRRHQRIS